MRRRGRECALQILYQMDVAKTLTPTLEEDQISSAIDHYWTSFDNEIPVDREFVERLVRGVILDLRGLDEEVAAVSHNWKLERMGTVDRNLIRLAAYEILRCPDIPRRVSINEALEVAKRFSGEDSKSFINGILDRLGSDELESGGAVGGNV